MHVTLIVTNRNRRSPSRTRPSLRTSTPPTPFPSKHPRATTKILEALEPILKHNLRASRYQTRYQKHRIRRRSLNQNLTHLQVSLKRSAQVFHFPKAHLKRLLSQHLTARPLELVNALRITLIFQIIHPRRLHRPPHRLLKTCASPIKDLGT